MVQMMSCQLLLLLGQMILTTAEPATAAVLPQARWRQDRFAISMWVDPMVPLEQLPYRYAQMRHANFTVVMAQAWSGAARCGLNFSCQAQRIAEAERLVGIADAAGLKTIMRAFSNFSAMAALKNVSRKESLLADPLPEPATSLIQPVRPSLWGYDLWDEPSGAREFSRLGMWSDAIHNARPGAMRYINLLPNVATTSQWGFETYDEYLDQFLALAKPDVLCMDNYPHFELPDTDSVHKGTRDDYRRNLAALRERALKHKIPFWNYVSDGCYFRGSHEGLAFGRNYLSCMPHAMQSRRPPALMSWPAACLQFNTLPFGRRRDPSFGELCWQVFTSLAYGAKGILW
eukprot:COSAG01_NODE_13956_length_1514_cov_21.017668_1_plen_345_part_00